MIKLAVIDVLPWCIVLHCFLSLLIAHHKELDQMGPTRVGGAFDHFRTTLGNTFCVPLALVALIASGIFALCFYRHEKARRRTAGSRVSVLLLLF